MKKIVSNLSVMIFVIGCAIMEITTWFIDSYVIFYIGIITSCIGIVTIMYGVNFYNHPSRGNIVTCIALLFCCMLSIISCVLIVIKNYKNKK